MPWSGFEEKLEFFDMSVVLAFPLYEDSKRKLWYVRDFPFCLFASLCLRHLFPAADRLTIREFRGDETAGGRTISHWVKPHGYLGARRKC